MDYNTLASKETIDKTIAALGERNIEALHVNAKEEALEKIKELIPANASIMNGASRTLEQIGFIDYLKSDQHPWNNLHAAIVAESDPAKQADLRKSAVLSDYYLGSVHALAQTGEMVIASNTGSQLPHITYTSPNVIFMVGAQKIVPTLEDAYHRLQEYVFPLENQRMKEVYGAESYISKILTFRKESPFTGRKVRLILINEILGF